MNTSVISLPRLRKIRFFKTINLTANPIKGGTPPRLKNCSATSIFFLVSTRAASLNLIIFLVNNLTTAPSSIREYMSKNIHHTPPITPAIIHIPFPTEDKNSMNCSDKLAFVLTMIKPALININNISNLSFNPS